jgi:hypothetical protein
VFGPSLEGLLVSMMRTVTHIHIEPERLPRPLPLGFITTFRVDTADGLRDEIPGMVTGVMRSDQPGKIVIEVTAMVETPTPEEPGDFWP